MTRVTLKKSWVIAAFLALILVLPLTYQAGKFQGRKEGLFLQARLQKTVENLQEGFTNPPVPSAAVARPITPIEPESSPRKTYRIGEEAEYAEKYVTVKSVYQWEDAGVFQKQPAQGNGFIAVDVELRNNSQEILNVNPLNFSAINEKGQQFKHNLLVQALEPSLGVRELLTGDIARGWIVLEVPLQPVNLFLIHEFSAFNGAFVKIRLK